MPRICARARAKLMIHGVTYLMGKQSWAAGSKRRIQINLRMGGRVMGTHLRTGLSPLGRFLMSDFLNH